MQFITFDGSKYYKHQLEIGMWRILELEFNEYKILLLPQREEICPYHKQEITQERETDQLDVISYTEKKKKEKMTK